MSTVSTGSQYGVGLITLLVASGIAIGYYQMYWLPEQLATPDVDEHVLHPVKSTTIEMIMGSASADQQDNFVPKLVNLQLSIDNHVIWKNVDETAHTVTLIIDTLIAIVETLVQRVSLNPEKNTNFYSQRRHQTYQLPLSTIVNHILG